MAVLCLALGICASITVFSVVDALLLRPLPGVADPGRLVSLASKPVPFEGMSGGASPQALSYPELPALPGDANHAFTDLAAYVPLPLNLVAERRARSG